MITNTVLARILIMGASLAVIGILFLIRYFLVKGIFKKDIDIVSRLIIGNEEIQEDAIGISETENGMIAVLADGLGKKEAGRVSSQYAVKEIQDTFEKEGSNEMYSYFFKKAYNKANSEIIKRVEKDKGGVSVLSVIISEGELHYALIGDAMLSIYRKGELHRISTGHSIDVVAQKQYSQGKLAKEKAMSVIKDKKLLYYLGHSSYVNTNLETETQAIKLQKNDIIVLMSKGIHTGVRWIEIEQILSEKIDLEEQCKEIVLSVDKKCNGSIILMKNTVNTR